MVTLQPFAKKQHLLNLYVFFCVKIKKKILIKIRRNKQELKSF